MTLPAQQSSPSPSPAGREAGRAEPDCLLLKHGEVTLRGRNRSLFLQRLHDNLRAALSELPGRTRVAQGWGVTVVSGEPPWEELLRVCRRVMGFNLVQPALRVTGGPDELRDAAVEVLRSVARERPGTSFAVRARRRDKTFPYTSSAFSADVGARIHGELGLPVNLTAPGVELRIEIDSGAAHLTWMRHRGQGGLPVGSSGQALALLSGGYDSPVAAYRAMRRGLRCDYVHFTGAPFTDPSSAYKAYALARTLNAYQPAGRLHVIPLGAAQKQLAIAGAGKFQVVAQRRLMVRTAGALAQSLGAGALVTGDSLGQVASQTLANLAAVDDAAQLPLLRPLIGWEKQEIIDEARTLGTADISVLPDEDCCSLLAPRTTATRSHVADLEKVEKRLEMDELVGELLAGAQIWTPGETVPAPRSGCRAD